MSNKKKYERLYLINTTKGVTYLKNLVLFESVGRLFESYLVLFKGFFIIQ